MPGESYTYSTLIVTWPRQNVAQVEFNRPAKRNAMGDTFFREIRECFIRLDVDQNCRAVVLSGAGKMFSSGIDLSGFSESMAKSAEPSYDFLKELAVMQDSINVIEQCSKPVIAAIHSVCLGAAIDLICCCDVRYCTQDALFQIKEIDLGIAADLGTLQRFPKLVGNDSYARELAVTARKFYAEEARQIGFVSKVVADRATLIQAALDTASLIASKSPAAVKTTKASMLYSRDHSVAEGLDHIGMKQALLLLKVDPMKVASQGSGKNRGTKSSKL